MSKLAHSNQKTMDEIEARVREEEERGVPDGPMDMVAVYRDIFAEITAKATPWGGDDVEAYIVPKGCIHRAAGRLGFQMFDGEQHMKRVLGDLRSAKADNERLHRCITMAMGCLDPESRNADERLAWLRLFDAENGNEPRASLTSVSQSTDLGEP